MLIGLNEARDSPRIALTVITPVNLIFILQVDLVADNDPTVPNSKYSGKRDGTAGVYAQTKLLLAYSCSRYKSVFIRIAWTEYQTRSHEEHKSKD